MTILAGALQSDEGQIRMDGQPVAFEGPRAAQEHGIGIIYQELNLVEVLSVAENVFPGDLPRRPGMRWRFDWPELRHRAAALLKRVGARISPSMPVRDLSVAQKQMVEIARALARNVRVLILDEPTSSLTAQGTAILFEIIASWRERGVGIVSISHRLEEVFTIGQRVTAFRGGKFVGTLSAAEATEDHLVRMMVGRNLSHLFAHVRESAGLVRLEVRGLQRTGVLADIGFTVRAGEVIGLSGLVGAGRTEFARCIFGADRIDGGEILLDGKPVTISSPRDAVRLGIGMAPEDRKRQGLILRMAVRENISPPVLDRLGSPIFPSRRQDRKLVGGFIARSCGSERRRWSSGSARFRAAIGKWW
jgi:ribose transport system ATP-binding protein